MWDNKNLRIVIIGVGGIGGWLSDMVSRYIAHHPALSSNCPIILVDGDYVEDHNLERQTFADDGVGSNKAIIKSKEISNLYKSKIKCISVGEYITEKNINKIFGNNTIVMMGVDNFATRSLVSKYCHKLSDILLISGANEYTDGGVMIYFKENGIEKHPKFEKYYKEFVEIKDKNPADIGCEELINMGHEPQLIFANATAAVCMCWVLYDYLLYILSGEEPNTAHEIQFDIVSMSADAIERSI